MKKNDERVHGEIRGAQLIAGVWSRVVNSQQARTHLLQKVRYININNHKAQLYDEYPTVTRRVPTEMVTFKDLPFHVEDKDIFAHLYSQPDIQITKKTLYMQNSAISKENLPLFYPGGGDLCTLKLD